MPDKHLIGEEQCNPGRTRQEASHPMAAWVLLLASQANRTWRQRTSWSASSARGSVSLGRSPARGAAPPAWQCLRPSVLVPPRVPHTGTKSTKKVSVRQIWRKSITHQDWLGTEQNLGSGVPDGVGASVQPGLRLIPWLGCCHRRASRLAHLFQLPR